MNRYLPPVFVLFLAVIGFLSFSSTPIPAVEETPGPVAQDPSGQPVPKEEELPQQEENAQTGFWQRTATMIKREADQLIEGYKELSLTEKTLKPLLDAELHLYNAEHDIFAAHDETGAREELEKALGYLADATEIAKPGIRERIQTLRAKIGTLAENLGGEGATAWKDDSIIHALDASLATLQEAAPDADPATAKRLERIRGDLLALRKDLEGDNVRKEYDAAMATLKGIVEDL